MIPHAGARDRVSTLCLEHPDFQKLSKKSGGAIWGILSPFATLRDLQSQQPSILLPGDLCAQAPTFRVPPPVLTGPLGEEPHVYSHRKWSKAGGQWSGAVDIWVLVVACDLLR